DDSWILPARDGLVPVTAPTTWMAKQDPSASIMSTDEPVLVSLTEAGYTLTPMRASFWTSASLVDMVVSPKGYVGVGRMGPMGPIRPMGLPRGRSTDHQLVAQHEAGGVPRAGVDVLDAPQVRLVVLQGR